MPKKFSHKEIAAMPRKNITAPEFLKIAKRIAPNVKLDEKQFTPGNNGMFLAIHSFNGGKKWYRLHLKSLWIKPFNMKYSVHANTRSGRELLISSVPLPKGEVLK